MPISQDTLEKAILRLVAARGPEKSICPSEVARALAGTDEKAWRQLMKPIRAAAIRLAGDGLVVITRKGKTVDSQAFKGVYRLRQGTDAADGNSRSVRPVNR